MPYKRKRTAAEKIQELAPGKVLRQTTKVGGRRMIVEQRKRMNGEVTTRVVEAAVLEVDLQAAQVIAMQKHAQFGVRFVYAASMEAGKRGAKAISDAQRSGMITGEPDLRLYMDNARIVLVENKESGGKLSQAQKDRHAALKQLGHIVEVVWASTEAEAAEKIIEIVDYYL